MPDLEIRHISQISDVPRHAWNAMVDADNPFMRHEFLNALEQTGCVDRGSGWQPHHVIAESGGEVVGAMPLYFKYHSYGEYVFDWAWADAYERAGMRYYPKLLCSVPFTPVTGGRILVSESGRRAQAARQMVTAVMQLAEQRGLSSIHWLFTNEEDTKLLEDCELMMRQGSQFHWHNKGFADFDAFLGELSSKRRKNIKRERRRVIEQDIEFENLSGEEITIGHWDRFYQFYISTIESRGAIPYLTREFFEHIGASMESSILLTLARIDGEYVAGALNLKGAQTLYGRYWGSHGMYENLHFETCYYQGIEYCIQNKLTRFEAGAQGEHKLNRGLLPTATWSAHWVSHPGFQEAIADFLDHERPGIDRYMQVLQSHSPFKQASDQPPAETNEAAARKKMAES